MNLMKSNEVGAGNLEFIALGGAVEHAWEEVAVMARGYFLPLELVATGAGVASSSEEESMMITRGKLLPLTLVVPVIAVSSSSEESMTIT